MFAHPQIALDAYLRRDYENERECEYVDGTLVERTGGSVAHGMMHVEAGSQLCIRRKDWQIEVLMSYSMWTSPTRIRIPDLVILNDGLREDIRTTPPLLCIEILAPRTRPAPCSLASRTSFTWASRSSGFSTPSSASP